VCKIHNVSAYDHARTHSLIHRQPENRMPVTANCRKRQKYIVELMWQF